MDWTKLSEQAFTGGEPTLTVHTAAAEVGLNGVADGDRTALAGEVRTESGAGDETWLLDLSAWSIYYRSNASLTGIGSAFSESRELVKGYWWQTFGILFVMSIAA